jgi:hypothetical protein
MPGRFGRRLHGRGAMNEDRRVSTSGKVDDEIIGSAFRGVVRSELLAQAARLYADNGVGSRVEGRVFIEDFQGYGVLLDYSAFALKLFPHDVCKEALESFRIGKALARSDAGKGVFYISYGRGA